ncbi:hypothetical protein STENM327S_01690 [Streptomyces tendae]
MPCRVRACARASARVARVVIDPEVDAEVDDGLGDGGAGPETMHSAPIRRAAATVFIRCCATSESTVGTPVMSRIGVPGPLGHDRSSRFSITTWLRALSRCADQRHGDDAFQQVG